MLPALLISFWTVVHAGSTAASMLTSNVAAHDGNTSKLSLFDDELAKIAATCLSSRDYEQLAGNIVRHGVVRSFFGLYLVQESTATIGLTELREALSFPPLPPWQYYNATKPSEEELEAAPTIQAYYDLSEPRSEERSLNSVFLLEQNLIPAIAFLDERYPVLRKMFRRTFSSLRQQNPELTDRKVVDRFIDAFVAVQRKAKSAVRKTLTRGEECWDFE